MNERLRPDESEINNDAKQAFIEKARNLAPFKRQHVDVFGSYVTNFEQENGYTSVYIPGLAGHLQDGELIDDAVRILERKPEELDNGFTIVRIKNYIVHVINLKAQYREDVKVFDSDGNSVNADVTPDMKQYIEAYDMDKILGVSPVFTYDRLHEVYDLLDSLDPNDTF